MSETRDGLRGYTFDTAGQIWAVFGDNIQVVGRMNNRAFACELVAYVATLRSQLAEAEQTIRDLQQDRIPTPAAPEAESPNSSETPNSSQEESRTVPPAPVQIPAEPPLNPDGPAPSSTAAESGERKALSGLVNFIAEIPFEDGAAWIRNTDQWRDAKLALNVASPKPAATVEGVTVVNPIDGVEIHLKRAAPTPAVPAKPAAAGDDSDSIIGRPDKPFHMPECKCDSCLAWIKANPTQPAPTPAVPAESGEARWAVCVVKPDDAPVQYGIIFTGRFGATQAEAKAAAAKIAAFDTNQSIQKIYAVAQERDKLKAELAAAAREIAAFAAMRKLQSGATDSALGLVTYSTD